MMASFSLLYSLEHLEHPQGTVKIIGHQWYWTYEIATQYQNSITKKQWYKNTVFDSYMIPDEYLDVHQFRLLEADRTLTLPRLQVIRFIFTGADVIHS